MRSWSGSPRRAGSRRAGWPASVLAVCLALAAGCVYHATLVPVPAGVMFLVGCGGTGSLEWRDPGSGALLHEVAAGTQPVALAVAPRSSLAAVAERADDTLAIYDLNQRTPPTRVALPAGAQPSDVVAHRSHAALVACPGIDAVLEVQLRGRRVSRRVDTGAAAPRALVLDAARETLYVAHAGGEVSEVLLGSWEARLLGTTPGPLHGLALSAGGAELWLAGNAGLHVLELDTLEVDAVEGAHEPLLRVAADPGGVRVAAVGWEHLLIVSAPERRALGSLALHGPTPEELEPSLALDPRGEFALVACPGIDQVVAVDIVRGRVTARFAVGARPSAVAWIREPRPEPFLP